MTARVASLWRYPIKAIGREAVDEVTLTAGQTFPGDRLWAVAHEASKATDGEWSRCVNFIRGASSPQLQAVNLRAEGDVLHLSHPARPDLALRPGTDDAALIAWLAPLVAEGRSRPVRLVEAPAGRGLTDTSDPSISLAGLASHAEVEAAAGGELSIHRWRCNIWIDGTAPWEEFGWVGQTIRIGEAELEGYKRIDRCQMTAANSETGERDVPMLDILAGFGHQDFTLGLKVTRGGRVAQGDSVVVAA